MPSPEGEEMINLSNLEGRYGEGFERVNSSNQISAVPQSVITRPQFDSKESREFKVANNSVAISALKLEHEMLYLG